MMPDGEVSCEAKTGSGETGSIQTSVLYVMPCVFF